MKRAAKLGVTMTEADGKFSATLDDLKAPVFANSAADALDVAALQLGVKTAKQAVAAKVTKKAKKGKKEAVAKAAVPANRSVVHRQYKELYAKKGGNSGTPIAKALSDALLGEGPGVLPRIAKENSVPWMYAHMDIGRQRMCLGTILKGKDNRSEPVVILGKKVTNG